MQKLKITRKQVLMAVRYEPLDGDYFVKLSDQNTGKPCRVCAVGATLRQCGFTDNKIWDLGNDLMDQNPEGSVQAKNVKDYLRRKNYLMALSCYFEGVICPKYGKTEQFDVLNATPALREELAEWVEKNIPKSFTAKF